MPRDTFRTSRVPTLPDVLRSLAKDGPTPSDVHQPTASWARRRRRTTPGVSIPEALRSLVKTDDGPGLYVARLLTRLSEKKLTTWLRNQTGLDLAAHPHVTVVHSTAAIPWENAPRGLVVSRSQYRGWERLGDCYVLRFRSNALESRWSFALRAGATWEYPEYKPHLSVCSALAGDQVNWDRVPLPPFDLEFGPESSAPVEEPLWKAGLDPEALERLASAVHDSWLQHNADRSNAHCVAYEELDPAAKQVDRDAVSAVLVELVRLGYRVGQP